MTEKKDQGFSDKVLMTAIIAITIIECVALSQGIDGMILALSMAAIGGIVGWNAPQFNPKEVISSVRGGEE